MSAAEITVPHCRPTEGDVAVRTHLWRPAAWRPADPVLIVLHGYRRNAADYRDVWAEHAERYGVLVAAPEFDREQFPGPREYEVGNMRTPDRRAFLPEEDWSFGVVESAFDAACALERGGGPGAISSTAIPPADSSCTAWALFRPDARIEVAVAANAGAYTVPREEERYPYGLTGFRMGDGALAAAFSVRLTVLLGEDDTVEDAPMLLKSPEAMAQGPHRFARRPVFLRRGRGHGAPPARALRLGAAHRARRRPRQCRHGPARRRPHVRDAMMTREDCAALDSGDPLAYLREEFLLPAGALRLDSDRLGPLSRAARARLDGFLRVDWGAEFTDGSRLAEAAAGKLAPLVGAPAASLGFAASADGALEALRGGGPCRRPQPRAGPARRVSRLARPSRRKGLERGRSRAPGSPAGRGYIAGDAPSRSRFGRAPRHRRPGRARARVPAPSPFSTAPARPARCLPRWSMRASRLRSGGAAASSAAAPARRPGFMRRENSARRFPPCRSPPRWRSPRSTGALDTFAGVDIAALGWKARTLSALFPGSARRGRSAAAGPARGACGAGAAGRDGTGGGAGGGRRVCKRGPRPTGFPSPSRRFRSAMSTPGTRRRRSRRGGKALAQPFRARRPASLRPAAGGHGGDCGCGRILRGSVAMVSCSVMFFMHGGHAVPPVRA